MPGGRALQHERAGRAVVDAVGHVEGGREGRGRTLGVATTREQRDDPASTDASCRLDAGDEGERGGREVGVLGLMRVREVDACPVDIEQRKAGSDDRLRGVVDDLEHLRTTEPCHPHRTHRTPCPGPPRGRLLEWTVAAGRRAERRGGVA